VVIVWDHQGLYLTLSF